MADTPQTAQGTQPVQYQNAPPEVRRSLDDLRKSINAFHSARLKTNEARLGLVPTKVPPEQAAQIIAAWRDPRMEEEAVQELRAFLAMLLEREPTSSEMEQGPPPGESLGILPLVAIPLIVGGAATLSTLFGYLTAREQTAQAQLGVGQGFWARAQGYALQALPWVAVAGAGWVGLRMYQGKPILPKRPVAAPAAAAPQVIVVRKNEGNEGEDEEPDEDEVDDELDDDEAECLVEGEDEDEEAGELDEDEESEDE